jgi:hypothetical protein
MRRLTLFALALAGCAATDPLPAASPASTAAPEAAAAAPADCSAAMTGKRPEGWIDAGKIVIIMVDGKPTSVEIRDASGKSAPSPPIDAATPEASRENLRKAVCLAGGVLGVVAGKPPRSGTMTIDTVRPAREDPAADLALLCSEPRDLTADLDPSQKVTIARVKYGEQLTSARYRGWLHHLSVAVHDENAAEKASQLDTLSADAKAAGKTSCWFPDTLRH